MILTDTTVTQIMSVLPSGLGLLEGNLELFLLYPNLIGRLTSMLASQ